MTQEQLLQEAREEAEKVYPKEDNNPYYSQARRIFVNGYIANAKKQNAELVRLLDSIREYEHESGKAICYDERESEEFVNIYIEQQPKQE